MRISDWSSDVCSSDLAALDPVDVDAFDLGGAFDQAFAEREADRIILEIGGGRHHHRIADAADLDRHRHFDRDIAQQFGIRDPAETDPAHRPRPGGPRLRHRPATPPLTAPPTPAKAPNPHPSPPPPHPTPAAAPPHPHPRPP